MASPGRWNGPAGEGTIERTFDYVDDVQVAVNILVGAGVDEPRSLTLLTRESGVNLTASISSRRLCPVLACRT